MHPASSTATNKHKIPIVTIHKTTTPTHHRHAMLTKMPHATPHPPFPHNRTKTIPIKKLVSTLTASLTFCRIFVKPEMTNEKR
jgi:hypothetical protein